MPKACNHSLVTVEDLFSIENKFISDEAFCPYFVRLFNHSLIRRLSAHIQPYIAT